MRPEIIGVVVVIRQEVAAAIADIQPFTSPAIVNTADMIAKSDCFPQRGHIKEAQNSRHRLASIIIVLRPVYDTKLFGNRVILQV